MPLQYGPLLITGTIDNACFYGMYGNYYVRMKSSLTRKRVLKDPKFQLTRVHAALLGEASKIASRVYRLITGERKKHALYREITGKAIYLLREGKDKEDAFEILCGQYLKPEPVKEMALEIRSKRVEKDGRGYGKVRAAVPGLKKVHVPILQLQTGRRRMYFTAAFDRRKQLTQGP
jgi:hypothetical protein